MVPLDPPPVPARIGLRPMQDEIRRLSLRRRQAVRAGNIDLSSRLGRACDTLTGQLSGRSGGADGPSAPQEAPPSPRETQADFWDFAR